MYPRVQSVLAQDDYRLALVFTNGEHGVFDCKNLLGFGVFQELQDPVYFREARVEYGTVVWPHEQDICPDTLYMEAEKTTPRQQTAGGDGPPPPQPGR